MDCKLITVFTPTYNRSSYLKRLYESLLSQSLKDFEWLIVDDGSKDDTKAVVAQFQAEQKINLRYVYQPNAGKHIAINTGVEHADGILFFIVDSDDILPEHSLQTVATHYQLHKAKEDFGGVVGRRLSMDNKMIGTVSSFDTKYDSTLNLRYKFNIWGDFAEVYLTSVLKEFPFPDMENERFVPEGIVWNRIAQKYKVFFINEGIYNGEYLADGLTSKMVKIRMRSPRLSMQYYVDLASYQVPFKEKIKAYINFWRFAFHSKTSYFKNITTLGMVASVIGIPFGFLMYLKDKKQYD